MQKRETANKLPAAVYGKWVVRVGTERNAKETSVTSSHKRQGALEIEYDRNDTSQKRKLINIKSI